MINLLDIKTQWKFVRRHTIEWACLSRDVGRFFNADNKSSRALHSELLTELSSRVSCRDESERVRKKLEKTRSDPNFRKTEGTSRNEFSRVGTSSEKARKTRSDPNFWKTAISKTRKNKNFGKNRLTHGLKI